MSSERDAVEFTLLLAYLKTTPRIVIAPALEVASRDPIEMDEDDVLHALLSLNGVCMVASQALGAVDRLRSELLAVSGERDRLREIVLDLLTRFEHISDYQPKPEDCDPKIHDAPYIEIARFSKMRSRQTLSKYFHLRAELVGLSPPSSEQSLDVIGGRDD